jgi:Flp pilus assembly protein TadB
MQEVALAFITNMSGSTAIVFVAFFAGIGAIVVTFRLTRASEAAREAREEVRSRELNQINASLADLHRKEQKILYLEGQLADAQRACPRGSFLTG